MSKWKFSSKDILLNGREANGSLVLMMNFTPAGMADYPSGVLDFGY
jgi:hypothetical protein